MEPSSAEAKPQPAEAHARPRYELAALVVAVIGAVAAILIPFAVEVFKEQTAALTLRTIANRPLVTFDAQRAGGLQMTFDGAPVAAPWLISLVVENASDLPIDRSGLTAPVTIAYDGALLLRGTITERRPDYIAAELQRQDGQVTLTFNLLNRGESIGVDLLFDRQPRITREFVHLRGGQPLRRVADVPTVQPWLISWPALPAPFSAGVMILANVGGLLLVGGGVAALVDAIPNFGTREPAVSPRSSLDAIATARRPLEAATNAGLRAQLPYSLGRALTGAGLEPIDALDEDASGFAVKFAQAGAAAGVAAADVRDLVARAFRAEITAALYIALPHPFDVPARDAITALAADAPPERILAEAQDRLRAIGYQAGSGVPERRITIVDRQDVLAVVALLTIIVMGLAGLSVALAGWRNLLAS